jgi:hypothetical protein
LVLLADAITKYLQGQASLWDVAWAALSCIPGTKGLTTVAAIRDAYRVGGASTAGSHVMLTARASIVDTARSIRSTSVGLRTSRGLPDVSAAHLDPTQAAGAALRDFAAELGGIGSVRAIHSGSTDAHLLEALMKARYRQVLGVNAKRYTSGVPGAGLPASHFRMNWTRCVIATDSALSGAPASALPLPPGRGDSILVVAEATGRSWSTATSYAKVAERIEATGTGSRGIVHGARDNAIGHVFNVINDEGIPVFLDGQTGTFANLEAYSSIHFMLTAP